ncbi:hypothetical protein ABZ605_28180 [Streptomyces sp. NPDC012765]|uniref:hypothetical protein n=1 Tax=Streptomyces sp. NPDC012765 TaxID=3155249 RepID=UPI0033FEEC6C
MTAATPSPGHPAERDTEADGPQWSTAATVATVFVLFVAFAGTILATVDMFINGWLTALAHVGWFLGIFLTIALVLGLFLALVLGVRHAARAETSTTTP